MPGSGGGRPEVVEHGGCGSYGNSGSGRRSSIQEVV